MSSVLQSTAQVILSVHLFVLLSLFCCKLVQAVRRGSVSLIDSLDQSFMHLGERMAVSSPQHSATPVSPAPHADEWAESLADAIPLPSSSPASTGAAVNLLD